MKHSHKLNYLDIITPVSHWDRQIPKPPFCCELIAALDTYANSTYIIILFILTTSMTLPNAPWALDGESRIRFKARPILEKNFSELVLVLMYWIMPTSLIHRSGYG